MLDKTKIEVLFTSGGFATVFCESFASAVQLQEDMTRSKRIIKARIIEGLELVDNSQLAWAGRGRRRRSR